MSIIAKDLGGFFKWIVLDDITLVDPKFYNEFQVVFQEPDCLLNFTEAIPSKPVLG